MCSGAVAPALVRASCLSFCGKVLDCERGRRVCGTFPHWTAWQTLAAILLPAHSQPRLRQKSYLLPRQRHRPAVFITRPCLEQRGRVGALDFSHLDTRPRPDVRLCTSKISSRCRFRRVHGINSQDPTQRSQLWLATRSSS